MTMMGHDIEEGHYCPKCGANSICTIEDGRCENQGRCDNCIKDDYIDRMVRGDIEDW